jgi:hypothetical protein
MPGDHQRKITHEARFQSESLASILVPVWILNVRYSRTRPPVRIVVNGQTGKIWGKPPLSPYRIGLVVFAALGTVFAAANYLMGWF